MPSWLRNTLKIWFRYWALALGSVPAGVLGTILVNGGVPERKAILICLPFAFLVALVLWRVAIRFNTEKPSDLSYVEVHVQYISSAIAQPVFQTLTLEDNECDQPIHPKVAVLGKSNDSASFRQYQQVA